MVEPLRDFNGYSWTTIPQEIESIDHNLIYQNLRILVGHKFLNKWVKNDEFIIDYFYFFTFSNIAIFILYILFNSTFYSQFFSKNGI